MKRAYGFTIVELLIVIVVIAILATLSYVGYTNISQRAENNKTLVAAEAYLKAIQMYKVDHGDIPKLGDGVCLGASYTWELQGLSSGSNQCHAAEISYYRIKGTLNDELSKYMGDLPQPSMNTIGDSGNWMRGIMYFNTGATGSYYLRLVQVGGVTCPSLVGHAPFNSQGQARTGGIACSYELGAV